MKKYKIKAQAVGRVAAIVVGADTRRVRLDSEFPALKAIAEAFKRLTAAGGYDNHETVRREQYIYDGLCLSLRRWANELRRD